MAMVLMGKQFGLEEMPAPPSRGADYSNTKELGRLIYTEYVYAFELAAVILLVAIVAAIALTLRQRTRDQVDGRGQAGSGKTRGSDADGVDAIGEERIRSINY